MTDTGAIEDRIFHRGETDYVKVRVKANVNLDAQAVSISVDSQATWITGSWIGATGEERTCQALVIGADLPIGKNVVPVHVKVVNSPATRIIDAGYMQVV